MNALQKPDLENLFLEEIATQQWHADAVGGAVADRQIVETDRKLASIRMTRDNLRYRAAYERVRQRI